MVFMERNNELDPFGALNLKQMKAIGSNENINIVVYMHCCENKIKKTKILFIKKNEAILLKETPENKRTFNIKEELISFCNTTIKNYPAQHYSLIFWNHGTGATEPCTRGVSSSVFTFDFAKQRPRSQHTTHLLSNIEIKKQQILRGLCFDDSDGKFLSEKQMQSALESICATSLCNKKFDLIGFDACLMSMIEVGSAIKNYAALMVGSQEVELGTGWNYARVLAPFLRGTISPRVLSQHIVQSYAKTYKATADYTLSAVDLAPLSVLEKNVQSVAQNLLQLIKQQSCNTTINALRTSRNRHYCTHFDDPSFIDLQHFYQNLLENISQTNFSDEQGNKLLLSLKSNLSSGQTLIKKIVFANKVGTKRSRASGLSIYFPEKHIHASYHKAAFTLSDQTWINFLRTYLSK